MNLKLKNLFLIIVLMAFALNSMAQDKPNILVIWGDDIGQFNISAYNMGMMGYKTPNIRPHRCRRRCVHRLVRSTELHGWSRSFHHRPVTYAYRSDQGRASRCARRDAKGRPNHRRIARSAGLRHRPIRKKSPRRP